MNQITHVPVDTMIQNIEFQDLVLSIETDDFKFVFYAKNPSFSIEDDELDIICENNELTTKIIDVIIMHDTVNEEYSIKIPNGKIVLSVLKDEVDL